MSISTTKMSEAEWSGFPNDIGRSIADIKPQIDDPDWPGVIADVIRNMSPVEREVRDSQGRWYSMRIQPYKTDVMKIEGAVMFLVDIDHLKQAQLH